MVHLYASGNLKYNKHNKVTTLSDVRESFKAHLSVPGSIEIESSSPSLWVGGREDWLG